LPGGVCCRVFLQLTNVSEAEYYRNKQKKENSISETKMHME